MLLTRCYLSGGPLEVDGKRIVLVRPPECRIHAGGFVVEGPGSEERLRYELAGDGPDERSMGYAYAGIAKDQTEDADAADRPSDRYVDAVMPDDGTPCRKTRLFFDRGPADGLFMIVLTPAELEIIDMGLAMEGASSSLHGYSRVPSWREPADLAPDCIVFEHCEVEAAPADAGGAGA